MWDPLVNVCNLNFATNEINALFSIYDLNKFDKIEVDNGKTITLRPSNNTY